MKRLLKISFDIFLSSFTPIISWFFIGIIINKDLSNVFSLTYPLQCLMGVIISIFGVGANVCVYKDKNGYAADNGIMIGLIVSLIVYGFIAFNCEHYIEFMNMDKAIYIIFCRYSILQILFQTILQLVLMKFYYLDLNNKANLISLSFNFMNFIVLIGTAFITKSQIITSIVTLIVLALFDIVLLIKNINKCDFKLNLKNCFRYDSVSCSISIMFFLIYLFGFSNSFSFGEKYIVAITFATLVTDVQWDMVTAIKTVAKIDLVKKNFEYKYHFINALKFVGILIFSVLIMSFIIYPLYIPDLFIISIFLGLHIIDFIMTPFTNIKNCYLELEYSATKTTLNTIVAFTLRTIISILPTPFCTIIGQISSSMYEFLYANISYRKCLKNKN